MIVPRARARRCFKGADPLIVREIRAAPTQAGWARSVCAPETKALDPLPSGRPRRREKTPPLRLMEAGQGKMQNRLTCRVHGRYAYAATLCVCEKEGKPWQLRAREGDADDMDGEAESMATFMWKVQNVSALDPNKPVNSKLFQFEGLNWGFIFYPGGYGDAKGTHCSLFLSCIEHIIPTRKVAFDFVVVDPSRKEDVSSVAKMSHTFEGTCEEHLKRTSGVAKFIELGSELAKLLGKDGELTIKLKLQKKERRVMDELIEQLTTERPASLIVSYKAEKLYLDAFIMSLESQLIHGVVHEDLQAMNNAGANSGRKKRKRETSIEMKIPDTVAEDVWRAIKEMAALVCSSHAGIEYDLSRYLLFPNKAHLSLGQLLEAARYLDTSKYFELASADIIRRTQGFRKCEKRIHKSSEAFNRACECICLAHEFALSGAWEHFMASINNQKNEKQRIYQTFVKDMFNDDRYGNRIDRDAMKEILCRVL